jgi:UDP-N-acetylmuramoyl-L-alanyl-D-glutamate--2,6-diaminopimelate ligase
VTAASAATPAWFANLSGARVVAGVPAEATAICFDSRTVVPGAVFVAIAGASFDGHSFIGDAVQRGAAYVIADGGRRTDWGASPFPTPSIVEVSNTRVALAEAASGFYGFPARTLGTIGVTGTDGKTTTTHLVAHVLNATGRPAGYLSSVEFGLPRRTELNASHMTTLEAPEVQRQLAAIRDAGARYAVIEASSHGLAMHRVDQCEFDVGVFTNLKPDHLDYHETIERYRDAKAELFRMLDRSRDKGIAKAAIVNIDDESATAMLSATRAASISYGFDPAASVKAAGISVDARGTAFQLTHQGSTCSAYAPLLGDFNVSNCLAAVAVALSQGVTLDESAAALSSFPGVPGRMEAIDEGQPFRVIVDIASTEQAMRNVLRVLRPATTGRLIVVFGAAGERDPERRHGIARAVAESADYAIITNEDPRSEDPATIIDEIAGALDRAGWTPSRYACIEDRHSALVRAFALAAEGDCVLLAGKGTEQSIVIGTTHHPWDERAVARELLRQQPRREGRDGV